MSFSLPGLFPHLNENNYKLLVYSSPEQQRLCHPLTDRQKLINELVDITVFNKCFPLLKGGHSYILWSSKPTKTLASFKELPFCLCIEVIVSVMDRIARQVCYFNQHWSLGFAESGLVLLMVCIFSDGGGDDSNGGGGFLKL